MKTAFYFLLVKTEQVNHKGRALGWAGERCKHQEPGGIWVDDHSFLLLFKKNRLSCLQKPQAFMKLSWAWEIRVFVYLVLGLFVIFVFVLFWHLLAIWFGQLTFFRLFGHVLSLFFFKKWKNEVRGTVKHTLYLSPTLKKNMGTWTTKLSSS